MFNSSLFQARFAEIEYKYKPVDPMTREVQLIDVRGRSGVQRGFMA